MLQASLVHRNGLAEHHAYKGIRSTAGTPHRAPLFDVVNELVDLDAVDIDQRMDRNPWRKTRILTFAKHQVQEAYGARKDPHARLDVQITLSKLLQVGLTKPQPNNTSPEASIFLHAIQTILERGLVSFFDQFVSAEIVALAPTDSVAFQQYLRRLIKESAAFAHPFYEDFLAHRASMRDIRAFLEAELSIDGRFDDLVALTQIGFGGNEKIVMGENYYDELGRGNPALMHTVLFESALAEVGAAIRPASDVPVEAFEAGNLAVVLASRRRYCYLAIGFLAATEFLVPHRFQRFMEGWLRNGLSESGAVYHREHISIDGVHARDWFEKLIGPEMDNNPDAGRDIIRGVMFRLRNSEQYLDALLQRATISGDKYANQ